MYYFFNRRKLLYIYEAKTWHDAQDHCAELNAILAEANSTSEMQLLQFYHNVFDRNLWVGASDAHEEGSWEWVSDGRVVAQEMWARGEPNNADVGEHCAELANNGLNDMPCSYELPFLCQFSAGENQHFCLVV